MHILLQSFQKVQKRPHTENISEKNTNCIQNTELYAEYKTVGENAKMITQKK